MKEQITLTVVPVTSIRGIISVQVQAVDVPEVAWSN